MKNISATYFADSSAQSDIHELSLLLDGVKKNRMEFTPWKEYPYKPSVSFCVACTADSILIKYFVTEKQIRITSNETNSPIWEDSCVEFFISFDDGIHYYNIEYNSIGVGLIGYGTSKSDRILLDPLVVNQVKSLAVINAEKGKTISWEITLSIPIQVFSFTSLTSLNTTDCRVNFYKCGDLMQDPHYVCWSEIKSDSPDFHRPDSFGRLQLWPLNRERSHLPVPEINEGQTAS